MYKIIAPNVFTEKGLYMLATIQKSPQADGGISILDASIGIDWHIPTDKALLSEKDYKQALLKDFDSPFTIDMDLYPEL